MINQDCVIVSLLAFVLLLSILNIFGLILINNSVVVPDDVLFYVMVFLCIITMQVG